MPSQGIVRTKRIGSRYLLVNDCGQWLALSKPDYIRYRQGHPDGGDKLEKHGMILTKKSLKKIQKRYRNKYACLSGGPSLHVVVPTMRCNLNCTYCHSAIGAEETDMTPKVAKAVVDFIFQTPSESIRIEFQGGEPLLNFPIVKLVIELSEKLNHKHNKDIEFVIVTNLTLMSKGILDYCLEKSVKIMVSLDGHKLLHDMNRPDPGGRGSYEAAVKWIREVKKKKPWMIEALLVVTRASLPYHQEIIDEYASLGFERIWLQPVSRINRADRNWETVGYEIEEYFGFWKKAMDSLIEKGTLKEKGTCFMLKKILTDANPRYLCMDSPCGAVIGTLAYDTNGDIYSCDEARLTGDDFFLVGDVQEHTYGDLLKSPDVKGLVELSVNETLICDACIWKPYCGICPVRSYAKTGNPIPQLPNDDRCRLAKLQFDYLFSKMLKSSECRRLFLDWIEDVR
ncbi:MAG: His-Xaa-Ser system radical SAM maturase HxsB [archaeon]